MAEVIDALELIGPTAFGSSEEYARYREALEALRDQDTAKADGPADVNTDTSAGGGGGGSQAPAFPYPAQR